MYFWFCRLLCAFEFWIRLWIPLEIKMCATTIFYVPIRVATSTISIMFIVTLDIFFWDFCFCLLFGGGIYVFHILSFFFCFVINI